MSHSNASDELSYQSLVERVLLSTLTTLPCCIFFSINVVMLFSLRSKPVFRETSRYILLYNLLFADTVQIALGQLMYLLATARVYLTYPVCGFLVMLTSLSNEISPLILVVMSLERYVAVCHPLRHASIASIRSTGLAVLLVMTLCALNILIRILLLLEYPFEKLESLQMKNLCNTLIMLLLPVSDLFDKAYTCFAFVLAGVVVIGSYVGVTLAARSASTDKVSASKVRNTLLLHLVQLGLSLLSTMHNTILTSLLKSVRRVVFVRIGNALYVCIFILPRCLSSLIYGIRDQTIRPILFYYLSCCLKHSDRK